MAKPKVVCRNIYEIRAHLGWSQQELAKALQVTQNSVSLWELGKTIPSLRHSKRIVELAAKHRLVITVDTLLNYKSIPSGAETYATT